MTSFLLQYDVQDPTTKRMPHLGPAMSENCATATAGILQCISEEGQALKRLLLVNFLGNLVKKIILSCCRQLKSFPLERIAK